MSDDLLSIGEASRLLGVTQQVLRDWDESGQFPAVRTPGGHRRYSLAAVRTRLAELPLPQLDAENRQDGDVAVVRSVAEKAVLKWQDRGYLDGFTGTERQQVATLLEATEAYNRHIESPVLTVDQACRLTEAAWRKATLRRLVNIQPFLTPCSYVFYAEVDTGGLTVKQQVEGSRVYKTALSLFRGGFDDLVDRYAEVLAAEIDQVIFLGLKPYDYQPLMRQAEGGCLAGPIKALLDYIVVPEEVAVRMRALPDFAGVDIFPVAAQLHPETFELRAATGRYPQPLTRPIFCPHILAMSPAYTLPGNVAPVYMRYAWLE